jgi:hypothetical protein
MGTEDGKGREERARNSEEEGKGERRERGREERGERREM